jgi:hypothetical protein
VRELDIGGHKLKLVQEVIGKRSETFQMTVEEFDKLNDMVKAEVISATDVEPPKFEAPKPEPTGDEEKDKGLLQTWEHAKTAHEDKVKNAPPRKEVNMWLPVTITHKAEMDGRQVRIFHTLRGPMLGMVVSESTHHATLYSPCMIDPNVEHGRVHYFPVAFAGFHFTVYKHVCMGESVPQEAEIQGYPSFVNHNRKGDYRFRQRAAYHHIDADVPDDAALVSAEIGVRDASLGLIPTSDTREEREVNNARRIAAMQKQVAETPKAEEPQVEPPPASEEPATAESEEIPNAQ